MIRIKTLRRLIEITHKLVEEYRTRSYRYMTFDEYLERIDTYDLEILAQEEGISERTMYDYVSAIKELCGIFGRAICHDMTDNQEFGHNVTDVQGAEILIKSICSKCVHFDSDAWTTHSDKDDSVRGALACRSHGIAGNLKIACSHFKGLAEDDGNFLVNCQDMTENQEFGHNVTDVKGAEIL